tara:strand:- start:144 stop:320 length:177 start_codon:yes stop_codon:yes gene_type:complete
MNVYRILQKFRNGDREEHFYHFLPGEESDALDRIVALISEGAQRPESTFIELLEEIPD